MIGKMTVTKAFAGLVFTKDSTKTTISTLTGDLELKPAGDVIASAHIDLNANLLRDTDVSFVRGGAGIWHLRNFDNTAYVHIRGENALFATFAARSSGNSLQAANADGAYFIGQARDTGVGLAEVFRLVGADDPYFSMGGLQEFKFYNSGYADGGGKEFKNLKHIMRKATVTGVAPSATAGVYGTATDILPTSGYYGLNPLVSVVITAGGTFGTETLTVRVTAAFSDATTASITKDFTAVGSTALTNEEIEDLMADGVAITKLSVDCKSTIASSTATGGADVAALNT
jgi:hypothetical protein